MDEPFVRQDEEKGLLQRSGGGPTVYLWRHSKYKLSHAFREYLHTQKKYALTAELLCYLFVEFVKKNNDPLEVWEYFEIHDCV